ncbi:MAG TPA: GGDEF domain-containing protein [Actinoplanes sp.]
MGFTGASRRRVLTRCALAGLIFGVALLAVGGLLAANSTRRAIETVDTADNVTDAWYRTSVFISQETAAMNDYLRVPDADGLRQLSSQVGSAQPTIDWLESHIDTSGIKRVLMIKQNYRDYTATLRDLVSAAEQGRHSEVAGYGEQAAMSSDAMVKLLTSDLAFQRAQLRHDLAGVGDDNGRLHDLGIVVIAADAVLLTICAGLLLDYQRRIERHAASNRHQARHDPLTGLANRRALNDELDRVVHAAAKTRSRAGLLLIDLNGFKAVNDSLGHQAGDKLLQEVAARLTGAVRRTDVVARIGGDEFAVLLTAVESVDHVAATGRAVLDEIRRPINLDGTAATVSASIGIALCPDHAADHEQLLRHADSAMYAAKRGHLGLVLHEPEVAADAA